MSPRLYLFIAWCLFLTGTAAGMSYFAWSPFAEGKRGPSYGFYGPTHK